MAFTNFEKLQTALLCDLYKPAKDRELDPEFIMDMVRQDHFWAIADQYPGMGLTNVEAPPLVRLVSDMIEMWAELETSYDALDAAGKKAVTNDPAVRHAPKFAGFDGNNEEAYSLANILVKRAGFYGDQFANRDLNSHAPVMDSYARMLAAYRPIRQQKIDSMGPYEMSAQEIVRVMRERVHPSNRIDDGKGGWTVKAQA